MCFIKGDKTKCMRIALLSIVMHTIILCISIVFLVLRIRKAHQESKSSIMKHHIHENVEENTLYALGGITLAFCLLGITASAMLVIGIKYKKPGYLVVFLCYIAMASILLLLGALLSLLLGGRWKLALAAVILAANGLSSFAKVSTTYDVMSQGPPNTTHDNSISDVTILAEEFNDESDDTVKVYSGVYSVE